MVSKIQGKKGLGYFVFTLIFSLILCGGFLGNPLKVQASTVVPKNYVNVINFNNKIKFNGTYYRYIRVTNNGRFVSIKISKASNTSVKVTSDKYIAGKTYKLSVSGYLNPRGRFVKRPMTKVFTIKSNSSSSNTGTNNNANTDTNNEEENNNNNSNEITSLNQYCKVVGNPVANWITEIESSISYDNLTFKKTDNGCCEATFYKKALASTALDNGQISIVYNTNTKTILYCLKNPLVLCDNDTKKTASLMAKIGGEYNFSSEKEKILEDLGTSLKLSNVVMDEYKDELIDSMKNCTSKVFYNKKFNTAYGSFQLAVGTTEGKYATAQILTIDAN